MLIWVCALHCEARPIIDYYRLKKSSRERAYELYSNDRMACVISGIGKLSSAGATAWAGARHARAGSLAWINLGTAGAADHELGALLLVNQVIDADSAKRYYPAPTGAAGLPASACLSLSQASEAYRPGYLFDMEASGFFASAARFSSAELIRCLKVVSDNPAQATGRDRRATSALIQRQLDAIDRQASELLALNDEMADLEIEPAVWHALNAAGRFSQTQQNRLRVLAAYLLRHEYSPEALLQRMAQQKSSRAMLESLEHLCQRDSENL